MANDVEEGTPAANVDATPNVFEGYISEFEYARQRGVSVRTCQRDRALRHAPPHVALGKTIFYRVDAVRAWLEARERKAERRFRAPRSVGSR